MPDRIDGYVAHGSDCAIPLAGAEHEYTRWGFRRFVDAGALDVLQPDLYWCGGLSETLKISAYATAHDLTVIPHGHSAAATLHFSLTQSPAHTPYQEDLVKWNQIHQLFPRRPGRCRSTGCCAPTGSPGLGMELDLSARRTRRVRVRVSTPRWWHTATVYQIYPRSFADSDGDGVGDLRGITCKLDHLAALGVDVIWLSPVYPLTAGRQRLRHQRLLRHRPDVRHAGRLRRAAGRRARPRHEAGHGPGGQPHLRRAPLVRASRVVDRQPEARLVLVAAGRRPTNWGSFFSGSAWEFDEATGEYYLHLFSRKQPDLNWENPESAARGPRDDALVAGPRCRRLPDGRHQLDLQGRRCPTGRPTASCTATPSRLRQRPPAARVPARDAPRGVRRDRTELLTVGETPGVTVERGAAVHRPGPRVSWTWCSTSTTSSSTRAATSGMCGRWTCVALKATFEPLAGRAGRRRLEQPVLEQPRPAPDVSRFGATTANTGSARRRCWPPCCTCTAARPYVYQGEELGHDERAVRRDRRLRRHPVAATIMPRPRWPSASRPRRVLAALRTIAATTPAPRCSGTAPRTPASPPALRGCPVNPNHSDINAAAQVHDPTSVFSHYRALIELRHEDSLVMRRSVHAAGARPPAPVRLHPHDGLRRHAGAGELLGCRARRAGGCHRRLGGRAAGTRELSGQPDAAEPSRHAQRLGGARPAQAEGLERPPRGAIQEATRSSIWLIANEAPSTTPMSNTCCSASADSKVLT